MVKLKLKTGAEIDVREPTAGDIMECEDQARRPHPTMATTYIVDTAYNLEMAKRVTPLKEDELKKLPDSDYKLILSTIDNFYKSDEALRSMKAFLEALLAERTSAKNSSTQPKSPTV